MPCLAASRTVRRLYSMPMIRRAPTTRASLSVLTPVWQPTSSKHAAGSVFHAGLLRGIAQAHRILIDGVEVAGQKAAGDAPTFSREYPSEPQSQICQLDQGLDLRTMRSASKPSAPSCTTVSISMTVDGAK